MLYYNKMSTNQNPTTPSIFPPGPGSLPYYIRKITHTLNNCNSITNITDFDKINSCFNSLDTISHKDIKNTLKFYLQDKKPQQRDIKEVENIAMIFNENKNLIEDGTITVSNSLDNLKYFLNEMNNEILKSSNEKFNVSILDNVKYKMIKNLGGVSNKKYMFTMILLIIMTLVVFVLLLKMFYKTK